MQLFALNTKTPFGNFCMIMDENDVVFASGFSTAKELALKLPFSANVTPVKILSGSHKYSTLLGRYFDGMKDALQQIPIVQEGTPFRKKVWKEISKIKWGKTESYKSLAEKVGSPRAMRAIGSACGANKLVLIVPCHRVLLARGGVGDYVYGKDLKERLLDMEQ